MFSAGWVFLSSSSSTNPNWAMAGCVEHSQAKSMPLLLSASAIGASQAASASRCLGG